MSSRWPMQTISSGFSNSSRQLLLVNFDTLNLSPPSSSPTKLSSKSVLKEQKL
uniref:Uncharacterized protein n=1 Tax=Arundo donax TaxID=35708 RepID=A0A0A9TRS7_ARUDO